MEGGQKWANIVISLRYPPEILYGALQNLQRPSFSTLGVTLLPCQLSSKLNTAPSQSLHT